MNSKEALELLKSKNKCIDAKTYRKMLEAIENDLEMLELLKPIIKASIRMSDLGISNSELALNIKANKMLKEWLTNDK